MSDIFLVGFGTLMSIYFYFNLMEVNFFENKMKQLTFQDGKELRFDGTLQEFLITGSEGEEKILPPASGHQALFNDKRSAFPEVFCLYDHVGDVVSYFQERDLWDCDGY